jgi:hypothetical protein
MEELAEIRISRLPMEEQPELLWAPMEQLELSLAPEEQKDQGLHGLLADQKLRLASATASIGLQVTRKAILIYFSGVLRPSGWRKFDFYADVAGAHARTNKAFFSFQISVCIRAYRVRSG